MFLICLLQQSKAYVQSRSEEQEFEVIPNPHDISSFSNEGASLNLDHLLEPYYLITQPLVTQEDTFQELTYAKVLTVPVPIYRMKQPARLSSAELEFQLVLVKELSAAGRVHIQPIAVDITKAQDSWFPGYYWNPLTMLCQETNTWKHVGWRFTALDASTSDLSHFYALLVQMEHSEKEGLGVRIGGFRVPVWMAAPILS